MTWTIKYKNSRKIEKAVLKMRPVTRLAFLRAIQDLRKYGPRPNNWRVKELKGEYAGVFSLRIDYRHRVLYKVFKNILTILIIDVNSREKAYQ